MYIHMSLPMMNTEIVKHELAVTQRPQLPVRRVNQRVQTANQAQLHMIVFAYIVSFGIAEVISIRGELLAVIYLTLILVNLLIHAGQLRASRERRAIGVLALVPLMRILGSTMLAPQVPELYWPVLVGAPLLLTALMAARFLDYLPTMQWPQWRKTKPVTTLAVRNSWERSMPLVPAHQEAPPLPLPLEQRYWQGLFVLIGLPLAIIAFRLQPGAALSNLNEWPATGIGMLLVGLFAGFTEAYIFYGLIQRALSEIFIPAATVLYTALLITLLSLHGASIEYDALVLIAALLFSLWTQLTRTYWGAVGAHTLLVLFVYYLLPWLMG
jgi:hypothetical protein